MESKRICSICGAVENPKIPMVTVKDGEINICEFCHRHMEVELNRIRLDMLEAELKGSEEKSEKAAENTAIKEQAEEPVAERKTVRKKATAPENNRRLSFTPSQIKRHLDKYIIGQEKAKKVLSVAVYNHYKSLKHAQNLKSCYMLEKNVVEMEKSNILMLGPTGVGKTAIVKALGKILDVPFSITDCTTLTANGYAGADPESCLVRLVASADGDIRRAEMGIVYLDEFDKISCSRTGSTNKRDVTGEDVQQALLRLMEGTISDIGKNGRRHPEGDTNQIDTSRILFIVGGAFPGIEKQIADRLGKHRKGVVGFATEDLDPKKKEESEYNELIDDVTAEDIRNFGIIPEMMGRLPVIAPLHELSEDEMCRILTEPRNALVRQYQKMFEYDDVELEFTDEGVRHIAKTALEKGTGARGLRSILENMLLDRMYTVPDDRSVKKMIVDKDGEVEFVREEDNTMKLDKEKVEEKKFSAESLENVKMNSIPRESD